MVKLIQACLLGCIVIFFGASCNKSSKNGPEEVSGENVLSVRDGNLTFSKDRLSYGPDEPVTLKFFNGLRDQAVQFFLLRKGEDPILVQHINIQKGEIPDEYFIYKTDKVDPRGTADISFKAPSETGDYFYVGITTQAADSLIGKLTVRTPRSTTTSTKVESTP